jgi:hypothetical protein
MIRRFATFAILLCLVGFCASAQGLNTQASKDDWEEINFEYNSAVLSDGFPSLLRLADLLSTHPGFHVRVEGHTDNLGNEGYNEKLGMERANTVRDFLVKYGAKPDQVQVSSRGATSPEAHGFKQHYSKTDVARWMNRRVVLTVTDEQGRTVSAGGIPEAIKAMTPEQSGVSNCCADILKRLDKLDEIAQMLKDLAAQNANLKQQVADLQQKQADLENQVKGAPKPLTEKETENVVNKTVEAKREKRFSLLGLNVGEDTYNHDFTFNAKARYFAPFEDNFAFEAQGEYDYYDTWHEGELDFGLVNRLDNLQLGGFASFKHVDLSGMQNGGTLGQASFTLDYIFSTGKVGLFATKAFLDNPIVNEANMVFTTTDSFGNTIQRTAPNVFVQNYLHVIDQFGVSTTVGLWGKNYFEGNIGYLRSLTQSSHIGGSGRLIFPLGDRFAFTVEGDANPSMVGPSSWGQVLAGIQFGNSQRPKDYGATDKPVAVDVPQIHWEMATRVVHKGASPPVADAGGNQIGVPAGTITLNGSRSYDPNGEALTYQWTVDSGAAALSAPTSAVTTFTAAAGSAYSFTLTVTNTSGLSASANALVTTVHAATGPQVLFCTAQPLTIAPGQSTTLEWTTSGATSVTITPGVGPVANSGSVSVTPTQSTNYVVTATNSAGSATCSIGVTVGQGGNNQAPIIAQFSANPSTINAGQSSMLSWQVTNATTVSISPTLGTVAASGSSGVTPPQTTTYTLTASNQYGSVTASVTVVVNTAPPPPPSSQPPVITSFTANPTTSPSPGSPVVLNCQATGVRAVNGILISGYAPVDQNGNLTVYPQQTTTYICLAINSIGQEATKTLTVPVSPPPPPPGKTGPVINLPLVVDSFSTSYTIDLTGTTSPTGAYPITYMTTSLSAVSVANPTSATPTVMMPALVGPNAVKITATDAKGQTTTFILTIYYIGPAAGDQL